MIRIPVQSRYPANPDASNAQLMPARAGLGSNGIEAGFSLKRSKTRKFVAQPLATRHHCAAITPHLIRLTAKTAFRGSSVNKFFGGIDQISCHQVFVLVA